MKRYAVLVAALGIATLANAQNLEDPKVSTTTITSESVIDYADLAKRWSLTEEEWARFEDLKKGPRGYWSPDLDPLTVLGVEARSDEERRRYAELQVRMEFERAERELAYQKAYNEAFVRQYPGVMPIGSSFYGSSDSRQIAQSSQQSLEKRLLLFVKPNCVPCDRQAKKLQDAGTAFDVYMLDTRGNDAAIRNWAKKAGIKPALVQSMKITLNHDGGAWKRVGGKGELPATFERAADGSWKRVD